MDENKKLLTSGGLGTMGYGLPAAIGAKFGYPDTPVICISGDGGVQMNIQELATATAYGLPVILCIFNNSYLMENVIPLPVPEEENLAVLPAKDLENSAQNISRIL